MQFYFHFMRLFLLHDVLDFFNAFNGVGGRENHVGNVVYVIVRDETLS